MPDPGATGVAGRPSADRQLRAVVRSCHALTGIGFVYGGLLGAGGIRLSTFIGARTRGLHGLLVRPGWGLGGKVADGGRPELIADYAADDSITHDYDRQVLGEGIRSVAAVPVVVGGRTRALLYAASRDDTPPGDRAVGTVVEQAGALARRWTADEEIGRRLREIGAERSSRSPEELRDVYRELRAIAQELTDSGLRDRLLRAGDRLIPGERRDAGPAPGLTARELDVLAQVAVGCSNREVADRLCLATETVKAYLKAASHKLGAGNRVQAVSQARRLGLLP